MQTPESSTKRKKECDQLKNFDLKSLKSMHVVTNLIKVQFEEVRCRVGVREEVSGREDKIILKKFFNI